MPADGDWDAGWASIERAVLALVVAAQTGAAADGAAMVPLALEQTGYPVEPLAQVNPAALTGYASDGRPLDSLLGYSVQVARDAAGDSVTRLSTAGSWLATAVHLQVADAARAGSSLAIAARPGVGWVRMVNPPCCGVFEMQDGRIKVWRDYFDIGTYVAALRS